MARLIVSFKIVEMVWNSMAADEDQAYPAKLNGESGHIIVEGRNEVLTAPQLTFVPIVGNSERFVWPLDDIVEIKKVCSFSLWQTSVQG